MMSMGFTDCRNDAGMVQAVREKLRDLGISGHVDHIEALMKARDGRAASRQLGLF